MAKNPVIGKDTSVPGIILRIQLENFMCHERLDWEPNKNVNFVTGVNGSGKSSILQGLVLGLLSDSKNTKRYKRMQDFVQKGFSRAIVQVTLKNEGEGAFKSEVYGPSITFQRTITDNGQTVVLIKDHEHNVVKKASKDAREEGKRILDNFRINTDNPIAILQQEEAKVLLKVESPENLYRFFLKATLLEQCVVQYRAAKIDLEKTRYMMDTNREQIRELRMQLNIKYEKLQELLKSQERDIDEENLQKEFLWALVKENRIEQGKVDNTIKLKKTALVIPREKLTLHNRIKDQLDSQMIKQKDILEHERGKYAKEERELMKLKTDLERLKKEERKMHSDLKGNHLRKVSLEEDNRIMEEQLDSQNSIDRIKLEMERLNKLSMLEKRRAEINEKIGKIETERDDLESQLDENWKGLGKCKYERKSLQVRKNHLEYELSDMMRKGDQGRLAVLDRLAPIVAEEIKSATRKQMFKVVPLGPLGSHVKLSTEAASNPTLVRLLETELGINQLKAYLCDNSQDRRVLWDIFTRVYGAEKKPQIFTSKFLTERHDVRRVKHNCKVMDYFVIESIVIFNHLVDQKSIESVVVCETQEEAMKICTVSSSIPRNMKCAITHDFYRFFPPTNTTSYRSYYMDPVTSLLLGTSCWKKVKEKKIEIQTTRAAMEENINNTESLLRIDENLKMRISGIGISISELRKYLLEISSEKYQLIAEEDRVENLETISKKLEENINEVKHLNELKEDMVKEKNHVLSLIKEKGTELAKISNEVSKLREATDPREREVAKLEHKIFLSKKEIANQERLVKRYQVEVGQLQRDLMGKKSEEEKFLSHAEQKAGPVVEPSGTVLQLNAKIKQIRDSRIGMVDREMLEEEYRELRLQYEDLKCKTNIIEEHLLLMEDMNRARNTNYLLIRRMISNIIERRFALISESFSNEFGTRIGVRINHRRGELSFIFSNADGDDLDVQIDSLSGGEKSFAQMCLIASLWEVMDPPFRALDEWDVFMDALNRKKIASKLLGLGLTKLDYQFIFISPQGAADLALDSSEQQRVSIVEVKKH